MVQKLKPLVSDEIYDRSRPPRSDREISAANEFVKMLSDLGINEVRFFDAETLISTTNIPDARKIELLDILHQESQADVQREISKLIENSSFANDNLKAMVTQNLFQAASYSPIYRDTILALIAWTEATSSTICEGISHDLREYPTRKLAFDINNESNYGVRYNWITIDQSYQSLEESFFDSSCTLVQNPSHLLLHYAPIGEALSHEAGHMISGHMSGAADILKLDSISMEVASRSVIAKELPGVVSHNTGFMKTLNDEDLSLLKEALMLQGFSDIPEDREQFIRWHEQSLSSPAMRARGDFNNSVELFQILGFFTASHSDSNVLYINLLSDAAYSIGEGLPLRCSHWGERFSKYDESLLSPEKKAWHRYAEHLKPAYRLSMNTKFYGALIEAYGFEMSEYKKRLFSHSGLFDSCWISPYTSLIPALKKMQEMNRRALLQN
jgi:hypothetical protein